jgi:nitric oxide reductase NorE protein
MILAPVRPPTRRMTNVPGELGIWVVIGGDLVLFSILFFVFLQYRAGEEAVFVASQRHLNQGLGFVNTVLMLSSSSLVASAVQTARREQPRISSALFAGAFVCGAGFIVVKSFEYREAITDGFTLTSNDFFMYYYVYTGLHLIHVVIGMGVLATLMVYARSGKFTSAKIQHLESGASFWHLVDLLWIVLFALLYLVGQS